MIPCRPSSGCSIHGQRWARGDITILSEHMPELLDRFHLNLDPNSAPYRRLGMAVLRADVRAHEALERRSRGEAVDTLPIACYSACNVDPLSRGIGVQN